MESIIEKIKKVNMRSFLNGPKTNSYKDKISFYCPMGGVLSVFISYSFSLNLKSTLMIGFLIPLGFFHKELIQYLKNNETMIEFNEKYTNQLLEPKHHSNLSPKENIKEKKTIEIDTNKNN